MSDKRYPEEFKIEAVKQVTERNHKVAEVASRLGVSTHSMYAWLRKFGPRSEEYRAEQDQQVEIRRLKAELKRVINRSRKRAADLSVIDRFLLGFWSLFLSRRHI